MAALYFTTRTFERGKLRGIKIQSADLMKILLAEDDTQVRTELCELLADEGYDVATAVDGIEAFEKFRDDKSIELLLLDIRMPRCTGLQTLDAIRKMDVHRERIFEAIFITGNNDSESVVSALKLDAFSFLFKPLVVEQLLEEIEDAKDRINQRRYRRFQQSTLEQQVESKSDQIQRLSSELTSGFGAAVELLALAAEYYIPGIELHIHRIGEMAACLGRRLGMDQEQIRALRFASILHDIGKLKGPEELYNAERNLEPSEFDQTKSHTSLGAEFLSGYKDPIFSLAQTIAAQHHENWDGSGYPAGLKGDEISLEAAIVHVVDVYDNLRAPRPYREAMPHHQAIDIICNGDEKSNPDHFNPKVLQTLLAAHRDIESIYERYRPMKAAS